jgi:hypothetical protein
MNHQPYENWLLDENPLSESQANSLEEHLQRCTECSQLNLAWMAARRQLDLKPQMEPKAGFSKRWMDSLAERRTREHTRQTRRLFIGFGATSLALLVLWLIITLVTASPASMLAGLIETVLRGIVRLQQITQFFKLFSGGVSIAVMAILWTLGAFGLCILATIWAGVFWRISSVIPIQKGV